VGKTGDSYVQTEGQRCKEKDSEASTVYAASREYPHVRRTGLKVRRSSGKKLKTNQP